MCSPCRSTCCHETAPTCTDRQLGGLADQRDFTVQGRLSIENANVALRDGRRLFRLRIDRLDLETGAAVALTGASGSGKTLLLELLGLLRAPGAGTAYRWSDPAGDSQDLVRLWRSGARSTGLARMRGRLFGFVPQTGGLVPFLTVAENISLPQRLLGQLDGVWTQAMMTRLELDDIAGLFPAALSIGQRQRVAVARALAHRPPFVIADEPTAALDPVRADAVLTLLLETAREQGAGVVLSSHDPDRMMRLGVPRLHLQARSVGDNQVEAVLGDAGC